MMTKQQQMRMNKSGKIMDVVDQINSALEDIKVIEEQQGVLLDVLSVSHQLLGRYLLAVTLINSNSSKSSAVLQI